MEILKSSFLTCRWLATWIVVAIVVACNGPNQENIAKDDSGSNTAVREKPQMIYDKDGNLKERHAKSYRTDNKVRSEESFYYFYDENGNLTEEIKESRSAEGVVIYKNINRYAYNEKNQKTEHLFFSYNKDNHLQQQARNTYLYDDNGNVKAEKSFDELGRVKSVVNTQRNEQGELQWEEYIRMDTGGVIYDHKKYYYTRYGLERTENLLKK